MKHFIGSIIGVLIIIAIAALVAVTGAYNVAASSSEPVIEAKILHYVMRTSVRVRAGVDTRHSWSDQEVRDGFKDYAEMCIVCHPAPGRERTSISKGMQPQPPNLADAARQWTDAQLFWIIKNGVRMTGMPAFGVSHTDAQIWSLVGLLRRLPDLSPSEFASMEQQVEQPGAHTAGGRH